jgi:hypothetical protein
MKPLKCFDLFLVFFNQCNVWEKSESKNYIPVSQRKSIFFDPKKIVKSLKSILFVPKKFVKVAHHTELDFRLLGFSDGRLVTIMCASII